MDQRFESRESCWRPGRPKLGAASICHDPRLGSVLRRVYCAAAEQMNMPEANTAAPATVEEKQSAHRRTALAVSQDARTSAPMRSLLAISVASLIAIAVHYWCGEREPIPEPRYFWFLGFLLAFGV